MQVQEVEPDTVESVIGGWDKFRDANGGQGILDELDVEDADRQDTPRIMSGTDFADASISAAIKDNIAVAGAQAQRLPDAAMDQINLSDLKQMNADELKRLSVALGPAGLNKLLAIAGVNPSE